jgi:myo-inositol 2-dehydrogenase / D-chiro-inositol 1-dehydrogenase
MDFKTTRRALMSGALGAAAVSAQTSGPEIRTAFIGTGNRGKSLVPQVLGQSNTRVTAVCDVDPNARDAGLSLAKRDSPRAFSDWRAMLDFRDIDAVVIATPCYLHAEMAAAALKAGKYVYCEKPMGITPEQVKLVLDAARQSKAFLQIGQQLRYFPTVREAVRQIHAGDLLGRTLVIKAQRDSLPVSPESQARRPAWYNDVRYSGDLIVENAIHNIDVCNWIANSRPVTAFGHGMKYFPQPRWAGSEMMDGFSVEYVYLNGIHLDYSQLYMHPRGLRRMPNGQWYVVFGQKGALDMTHEGAEFCEMNAAAGRDIVPADLKNAKENAMQEFFACIREKRTPAASVEVGATAALTTIMGREAIYRGRSVTWDELGVDVMQRQASTYPSPGFVSLMPEKDISEHWTAEGAPADIWSLAGDEIICAGKPNGFLRSRKSYRNYVLRAEWRFVKEGWTPRPQDEGWPNAGFFIHANELVKGWPKSLEVQGHFGEVGSVFGVRGGSIKGAKRGVIVKDRPLFGEWDKYEITSQDGKVTVRLNGEVVNEGYDAQPAQGNICLQSEGWPVHYRNVEIRELS